MDRYFFIAGTLGLTVYTQLMVKSRALAKASLVAERGKLYYLVLMFTDPLVLSALVGAVLASALWILALQRTEVSLAYPFMALSFVLVPSAAAFLFKEPISPIQALGLVLVVAGVAVNSFAR
jgi:drug/metabolite transporter (DMT)-like permease